MKATNLEDLLVEELKDLYSAENQMVKALPKMAKAANSSALRSAFEGHLQQTRGQIERLDRAFALLSLPAKAKKCAAMEGLIEGGNELIDEDPVAPVLDAGLIGAAQKVEHYEIAAYGTARTHAELLGLDDVAALLEETLEEEKQTDEKLTELASTINVEAQVGDAEDDETSTVRSKGGHKGGPPQSSSGQHERVGARR
jgi:ferritin-like metal-binding protein YciE